MLRQTLLALSRSRRAKELAETLPATAELVDRHVAGESVDDVVGACRRLVGDGLAATVDYLGEDTEDREQAEHTVSVYLELLDSLASAGLASDVEVSVKLSAVGQALGREGPRTSLENARTICRAARNAGTTVTIDMEDHTATDRTLGTLRDLRQDFPETGIVVQSRLRRTERDLRRLQAPGSRVRLCKGAYDEPDSVAFGSALETDKAYVRGLKQLFEGDAYPMIATHDPRLIAIAGDLAERHGRGPDTYEFQMLYGVRPDEQLRLARAGQRMRVYVPFGEEWYGYLVRRLAERPSHVMLFARSLVSRK